MDNRQFNINEKYLDEILNFKAKSLVGKCLKRFELLEDKESVKQSVRELIYEEFRGIKEILVAHQVGLEVTQFNFIRPEKKSTNQ